MNFWATLDKRSKRFWAVTGFLLLGVVGILDLQTGYEFKFSFFYLIPISIITWFTGRQLGLVSSFVSACVWLIVDLAAGHLDLQLPVYAWNTSVIFSFFVLITLLLSALRKALEQERELARTDYLTGAVNSRVFFDLLQMEISRSQRYKHPFTLVYIDIDNFKAVNDRFGHTTGDQVLRAVVEQARKHLRKSDVIARLGGDEFAILLPETDQEAAQTALSKIQREVFDGMHPGSHSITLSVGALTCMNAPRTTDEIIRMADDLMYSAKHGSKNAIKSAIYPG